MEDTRQSRAGRGFAAIVLVIALYAGLVVDVRAKDCGRSFPVGGAQSGGYASGGDAKYRPDAPGAVTEVETPSGVDFMVYPNPSRGQASRFTFRVSESGPCLLEIFAADGRMVRRVADGTREPGTHTVFWDNLGERESVLPSGLYFARLRLGNVLMDRRMVILR